jgi:glutathione S-transferase
MLRLHDNPISSNALKVRFLLAELGLEYERVEVPMTQPRPEAYVALNPVAGVPTLEDDGFVLAESNTILRYLAEREGRDDLRGAGVAGRARVDELLDRWSLTFRPAFFRVERPAIGFSFAVGFGGAPPDPAAAREAEREVAPVMRTLDGLLPESGFALGETLTIADCSLAPALYRTLHTGMDLAPYPRLRRLRDDLVARPSFVAAGPVG